MAKKVHGFPQEIPGERHNGRPLPPVSKVRTAKLDTKIQKRALAKREEIETRS
jgi:hypothetical protein